MARFILAVAVSMMICHAVHGNAPPENTTAAPSTSSPQYGKAVTVNHIVSQKKDGRKNGDPTQALATVRQGGSVLRAVMSTATGILAAVGGGFLLYNGLLAVLGEEPLSRFPIFTQQEYHRRHPYIVAPSGYYGGLGPKQRSDGGKPSKSLQQLLKALREVDFPEKLFQWLRVYDETCKQRTVCEIERFLTTKGVAGLVLNFLSPQIPGMHKYTGAISRGLRNENCGVAYRGCPESLGQRLLKLIGLR